MEYHSDFDVNLSSSPFTISPPTTPFQTLLEDVGRLNIASHDPSPNTNLHGGPTEPSSQNLDRQNQNRHVFRNFRDYKDALLEIYLPDEVFSYHDSHPYSRQQELDMSLPSFTLSNNAHESPVKLQQSRGFVYPRNNQRPILQAYPTIS